LELNNFASAQANARGAKCYSFGGEKMKDERTRNWLGLVYPESAPKNWREILDELHIEWVESPLHDKDINETAEDEHEKKAHYHILLLFNGNKSYEQIKEITYSINAPIPKKCNSVKGSIRYMVHKDNPEKYQYSWYDIVPHGGADLNALCQPTSSERLEIQKAIIEFILEKDIDEFEDIVNYSMKENSEWLNILLNYSTISITAYICSRRYKKERAEKKERENSRTFVDQETGELVTT